MAQVKVKIDNNDIVREKIDIVAPVESFNKEGVKIEATADKFDKVAVNIETSGLTVVLDK